VIVLPKKRKSGGRSKGGKGRTELVQCAKCGQRIPRDKAKKVTRYRSLVDPMLARELRKQGAIIPRSAVTQYLCIRCAVHYGVVKIRSKEERKKRTPL